MMGLSMAPGGLQKVSRRSPTKMGGRDQGTAGKKPPAVPWPRVDQSPGGTCSLSPGDQSQSVSDGPFLTCGWWRKQAHRCDLSPAARLRGTSKKHTASPTATCGEPTCGVDSPPSAVTHAIAADLSTPLFQSTRGGTVTTRLWLQPFQTTFILLLCCSL